jgi:hypothetical protein
MTKLRAQFKELLEQAGLLKKDEELEAARMSSSERAARHGELRQLRTLKREAIKKEGGGNKKKKTLKKSNLEGMTEDGDEDGRHDLKDIEFRMRHDGKKVRHLLEGTKAYSYKDLTLLKIILTSGLYPQLAVGDEFNTGKSSGADLLFHTKVKPFNVLHPNCIFAVSPEFVLLEQIDTVAVSGFPTKYPVSAKHQMLVYLSLLETNKPYVMNAMRMPSIQTLLLFSQSIDTNGTFSRMVFDSWLELRFPDAEQPQDLMWKAARLRETWQELLRLRLEDTKDTMDDPVARADRMLELEAVLSRGLVDFIHSETLFSIRRLLPADIKTLYVGEGLGQSDVGDVNPFGEREVMQHEKKGGMRLTDYLTYNCLENQVNEMPMLAVNWTCPRCEREMYVGPVQRIVHHAGCVEEEESERRKKEEEEKVKAGLQQGSSNPNAREYHCHECDKAMWMTSTEILKHKRGHTT